MLKLTRPRFFVPVHGEYRHLLGHAQLAESVGLTRDRIFVIEDGQGVELTKTTARVLNGIPAGRVFVDGRGVGDVGAVVLRDRQLLAEDGMIVVSLAVDQSGTLLAGPDLASRGVVYVKESEEILGEIKAAVLDALAARDPDESFDHEVTRALVKTAVRRFMKARFNRKPVVLAAVLEVGPA